MGQLIGSMLSSAAERTGTGQPVYIGTWHRDGKTGRKFNGMLRELRFWNCARSPGQMVECMFGLSGKQLADESLTGYWPLSGGTERYIVDLSKNRNHGMVRGDASWVWIDGDGSSPPSSECSIKFGTSPITSLASPKADKANSELSAGERLERQEKGMKRVLVTGGAGYIGSHVCLELLQSDYMVCVIDNYDNSSAESLNRVCSIVGKPIAYHRVDLLDEIALEGAAVCCLAVLHHSLFTLISHAEILICATFAEIFTGPAFEAVLHIAGLKSVSKSTGDPLLYYHNNVTGIDTAIHQLCRLIHVLRSRYLKPVEGNGATPMQESDLLVFGDCVWQPGTFACDREGTS